MDNTEVKIMILTMERERMVRQHIADGRILRALEEQPDGVERPDRGSALMLARHVAGGIRHSVRRWLALPWDEPTPRRYAAVAFDAWQPRERTHE